MNVIIVEDEITAGQHLQQLVKECDQEISVVANIESTRELESWTEHHTGHVDLALCDIELRDGNIFDFLKESDFNIPIIFITNYGHYAIQAFKEYSIDFILKPVSRDDLENAIHKFLKLTDRKGPTLGAMRSLLSSMPKKNYVRRFLVKIKNRYLFIDVNRIAHFKSHFGAASLCTTDQKSFFVDSSLNQIEVRLDPTLFFRINRRCIVNISQVDEAIQLEDGGLELSVRSSSEVFKISRTKAASFKSWMAQ